MNSKTVAIFGLKGSFHHLAAQKYFGKDISVKCLDSFQTLIETCSSDVESSYGVIAIENTLAGDVNNNSLKIKSADLNVIGEVNLKIEHHLMGIKGQRIEDIEEIRSHPTAINQCKKFLNTLENVGIKGTGNTAGNAKEISQSNQKNIAVIGSEDAARLYNLEILKENIQDESQNITRFLIVCNKERTLLAQA